MKSSDVDPSSETDGRREYNCRPGEDVLGRTRRLERPGGLAPARSLRPADLQVDPHGRPARLTRSLPAGQVGPMNVEAIVRDFCETGRAAWRTECEPPEYA